MEGYNEIIILKQLSGDKEIEALKILYGSNNSEGLLNKPHDMKAQFQWPTNDVVDKLREAGYVKNLSYAVDENSLS